jgi:hypothetical protein
MPGKQITRVSHAKIRKAGGENYVFTRIAGGDTLSRIAVDIGVSRPLLSDWANDAQRRDAYLRARQRQASALVDESLDIVDEADPQTVQLAKLRSETRRWMAGKLHREQWGEQSGPQVAIQINNLHAGMLRNRDWEE